MYAAFMFGVAPPAIAPAHLGMQSDALLIRVIRLLLSPVVHRLQRLQAMPTICRHRRPSCNVYSARFRMAGVSPITCVVPLMRTC